MNVPLNRQSLILTYYQTILKGRHISVYFSLKAAKINTLLYIREHLNVL